MLIEIIRKNIEIEKENIYVHIIFMSDRQTSG